MLTSHCHVGEDVNVLSMMEPAMPLDETTYRIDAFVVPDAARPELLRAVAATHDVLRRQPGFVRDLVAERTGGPGRIGVVTLVEWSSDADLDAAKRAVNEMHARTGFDRAEFLGRTGITADLGSYRATAVEPGASS